jgi:hypothetical protein
MEKMFFNKSYLLSILLLSLFSSCKKDNSIDGYTAYFGGEVVNPNIPYVLFCKGNKVLDTIQLKKDNTFFIKFDSLTPGLYSFKHDPEYQYVYFDKNDSIKVHVDTKDFDNSVIFCGRGDEKNNFLIEMYLRNERDKDKMFDVFDYDVAKFNTYIDNNNKLNEKFYDSKKEEIKWNDEFDKFASALVKFPYYTKKEVYPIIHKMRTGNEIISKLPKDYYSFRTKINFSDESLSDFSPFVMYLDHMLNNVGHINLSSHLTDADLAMKTSINKLNIADTLIKNTRVKNIVLNNIALKYLLEDQNMTNNNLFLDTYYKYSTDRTQKNEIIKIGNAIQLLKPNYELPKVNFIDTKRNIISSDEIITKNTVFYFWSGKLSSHLIATHKKIEELRKKHPNYNFIAINLNDSNEDWLTNLSKYKFDSSKEYKCTNFEDIKAKWAITKIHRTIIVDGNKKIKNAFTNLFELNFEDNLK